MSSSFAATRTTTKPPQRIHSPKQTISTSSSPLSETFKLDLDSLSQDFYTSKKHRSLNSSFSNTQYVSISFLYLPLLLWTSSFQTNWLTHILHQKASKHKSKCKSPTKSSSLYPSYSLTWPLPRIPVRVLPQLLFLTFWYLKLSTLLDFISAQYGK